MRSLAAPIGLSALVLALAAPAWAQNGPATLRYTTPAALHGLQVTVRLDALHLAEVTTGNIRALRGRPGIVWAEPSVTRRSASVATSFVATPKTAGLEWQYAATRANIVPASVLRAAARITIAVIDTGADLATPDIAAKSPIAYNAVSPDAGVSDVTGHGTFVASLAGGSDGTGGLFDGFGGDAQLMIVQAAGAGTDEFTDADEAAGIVWAVDHGAQIINLSLGGVDTSSVEQAAIAYAEQHGVLLVAAAGNGGQSGNRPIYPAALVGPGGLTVGASTSAGMRAPFSTSASYLSVLAPGVDVLGAVASTAPASAFPLARPRAVPSGGLYGYGTGTSYAAPEVSGAAALVWAANPALTAVQIVHILEQTASHPQAWSPASGFGVIDVAAAVAVAQGRPIPPRHASRS